MRTGIWMCALLLGWIQGTFAADAVLTAQLAGDHFNEIVRTEAPVAGGDILGVAYATENKRPGAEKLFIRHPAVAGAQICVEASTVNGGYFASNAYKIPDAKPGTIVQIPIDSSRPRGSSHLEVFKNASAETLAILVHLGDCARPSSDLLPVAWGESAAQSMDSGQLTIAVQSGRSSAFLALDENIAGQIACDPLTDGRRTAFDALCHVTLGTPAAQPHAVTLRLRRCAFDDCSNAPLQRVLP